MIFAEKVIAESAGKTVLDIKDGGAVLIHLYLVLKCCAWF